MYMSPPGGTSQHNTCQSGESIGSWRWASDTAAVCAKILLPRIACSRIVRLNSAVTGTRSGSRILVLFTSIPLRPVKEHSRCYHSIGCVLAYRAQGQFGQFHHLATRGPVIKNIQNLSRTEHPLTRSSTSMNLWNVRFMEYGAKSHSHFLRNPNATSGSHAASNNCVNTNNQWEVVEILRSSHQQKLPTFKLTDHPHLKVCNFLMIKRALAHLAQCERC